MDKINLRRNIKMKPSFFIFVFICLLVALSLSVATVHIVDKFVSTVSVFYIDGSEDIDRINRDRDEDIYIAVETIDKDFTEDDSDAILFYSRNWIVIALLIFYFILAIFIASHIFFKLKLDTPLKQLEDAAQKISEKNLDFEIEYSGNNEMGKLCESFETMRQQLAKNNIEMWNMIEEQKRVQHILAHDIRTPLTVLLGYLDIDFHQSTSSTLILTDVLTSASTFCTYSPVILLSRSMAERLSLRLAGTSTSTTSPLTMCASRSGS